LFHICRFLPTCRTFSENSRLKRIIADLMLGQRLSQITGTSPGALNQRWSADFIRNTLTGQGTSAPIAFP
jgi:hypothetical protein